MLLNSLLNQGITSPITHAGRVVYNARRDWLESRRRKSKKGHCEVVYKDEFGSPENHSIQPYELCFRSRTQRYANHRPNDTDMSVFSSANGFIVSEYEKSEYKKKPGKVCATSEEIMMDLLSFAGVACNRYVIAKSISFF